MLRLAGCAAIISLTAFLAVTACRAVPGARASADAPYIVVAPRAFHEALRPYIEYKHRDLPTLLVALEDILKDTPGADDPERLKRYLYQRWRERGARYALLVGDADLVPVRYMCLDRFTQEAYNYAFYPSDLYYSDLAKADGSFDDWNAQKEGFHALYFGEVRGETNKKDPINYDQVDYRPDIAVGRWPVDTPAEVAIVANKTIAYERSVDLARSSAGRVGLVTVGGWVDCTNLMDRMARELPDGWSAEKLYPNKTDPSSPPPDEAHVRDLLNDGVGLLLHAGHGHDNGWEGSIQTGTIAKLHNSDRLPVVMSAGCSTARFATLPPYEPYCDIYGAEHAGTVKGEVFHAPPPPPSPYAKGKYNYTGLGEQLLRGGPSGAVAYIGCNTGSQPCGLTLLEGLVVALCDEAAAAPARMPVPLRTLRLGALWSRSLARYYEKEHLAELAPNNDWYPPSIFFQGMKFMLFGDPTLRMSPVQN